MYSRSSSLDGLCQYICSIYRNLVLESLIWSLVNTAVQQSKDLASFSAFLYSSAYLLFSCLVFQSNSFLYCSSKQLFSLISVQSTVSQIGFQIIVCMLHQTLLGDGRTGMKLFTFGSLVCVPISLLCTLYLTFSFSFSIYFSFSFFLSPFFTSYFFPFSTTLLLDLGLVLEVLSGCSMGVIKMSIFPPLSRTHFLGDIEALSLLTSLISSSLTSIRSWRYLLSFTTSSFSITILSRISLCFFLISLTSLSWWAFRQAISDLKLAAMLLFSSTFQLNSLVNSLFSLSKLDLISQNSLFK